MRRRPGIDKPEKQLPSVVATYLSPASQPGESSYTNLVDEGKIGINDDQVSSGETPWVLTFLMMGG